MKLTDAVRILEDDYGFDVQSNTDSPKLVVTWGELAYEFGYEFINWARKQTDRTKITRDAFLQRVNSPRTIVVKVNAPESLSDADVANLIQWLIEVGMDTGFNDTARTLKLVSVS